MSNSRSRRRKKAARGNAAPDRTPRANTAPGDVLAPAPADGAPVGPLPGDWGEPDESDEPDEPAEPREPAEPARDVRHMRGMPLRLHATSRHAPGERRRVGDAAIAALDRVLRPRPFLFSERDWRRGRWGWWRHRAHLLPLVGLCLLLLLGAGTFAFTLASRAAASLTIQPPKAEGTPVSSGGIIMQSQTGPMPTPMTADYVMGVWSSSSSPAAGAPLQIFVRISRGDGPVAGVPVSLGASFGGGYVPLGARSTDGYGLAVFTVPSAGAPNVPVVVSASATVGQQTLSSTFQYLPQIPSAAPSPTPTPPVPPLP